MKEIWVCSLAASKASISSEVRGGFDHWRGLLVKSCTAVHPMAFPLMRLLASPPEVGIWAPRSRGNGCASNSLLEPTRRLSGALSLIVILQHHKKATFSMHDLPILAPHQEPVKAGALGTKPRALAIAGGHAEIARAAEHRA